MYSIGNRDKTQDGRYVHMVYVQRYLIQNNRDSYMLMENKTTGDRFKVYHISYLYSEGFLVIFQDIANDFTPDIFGQDISGNH